MSARAWVLCGALQLAAAEICTNPCRPWKWAEPGATGSPCTKGNRMDMRVILGDQMGAFNEDDNTNPLTRAYRTYFFCPEVDAFSSLQTNNSLSVLRDIGIYNDDELNTTLTLSVYGTGRSYETRIPDTSQDSQVVVYDPMHARCGGGEAAATFLVYNVTLDMGEYKYKDGDPVGNGFVSTCNHDGTFCTFDPGAFCMGSPGRYNCARCVRAEDGQDKANDLRVLVSYYGTDKDGSTMLSGSSNPLNFRQFAVGNLYADVKKDVSDISWGDVGL